MDLPLRMPQRLAVGCLAEIKRCAGLATLPRDMEVNGGLHIMDCPLLKSLSNNGDCGQRHIGGVCLIESCNGLERVDSLTFDPRGELWLRKCALLETIGDDVQPRHSLFIYDCPALMRLPARLALEGNLVAESCPSLKVVSELDVQGDIIPSGTTPRWEIVPPSLTEEGAAAPSKGKSASPAP